MLLSAREPSADTQKTQEKYHSNIISGFRRRSSVPATQTTNSSPRPPLAALDPQSVAHSADGMSSSPSYLIGRPISTTRIADDEDTENQKAQPIVSGNVDPITSTAIPESSGGRRASRSVTPLRTPSIMSAASSTVVGSPTVNVHDVDADQTQSSTNPAYLTNGDLYSNLATFSFGSPRSSSVLNDSSSGSYDADAEVSGEIISPLTPMHRRSSADRTPRPSVSGHSSGRTTSSHPSQQPRETTGQPVASTSRTRATAAYASYYDDEDNEDAVDFDYRRPHRGRMMSDTASQHTFGGGDRRSGLRSSSSSRSGSRSSVRSGGLEFSSEDEVELDYDSAHGTYTQGGLDVDEEFGAGGRFMGPTSQGRRGSLPMAIPGVPPDDDGARNREDSLATLRRPSRSLDDDLRMMNAAVAAASSNEGVVPKSEPVGRAHWRSLEAQQQQQQNTEAQTPPGDALDGYDTSYILEFQNSRRGSLALSYIEHGGSRGQPSRQSAGFLAGGWGSGLAWSGGGRRPSTATTGTMNDDSFTANVRRFDPDYGGQYADWMIKREKADGLGAPPPPPPPPPQSSSGTLSIRSGRGGEPAAVSEGEREKKRRATMAPGGQEMWRNEFVGRFKVDRLALRSRSQDPAKPPQQRLNVRHIPDPFLKGNKKGGPNSVVHKHSKAVAFSLFRHYGLLTKSIGLPGSPMAISTAVNRPLPGASMAIMLAPKKVQEQYTSTRTTSKLTTHGLLGDEERSDRSGQTTRPSSDGRRRAASVSHKENEKREKERKEKERKQREKEEKAKAKAKKGQLKKKDVTASAESSSTVNSAHGTIGSFSTTVEGKQRRHSVHQVRQVLVSDASSVSATSTYDPSVSATTTSSNTIKKHSSFDSPLSPTSSDTRMNAPELVNHTSDNHSDDTLLDRDAIDGDDDPPTTVTRTPHAEAFATLDPNVIEYVRSKNGPTDGNVHWSRRWLPGFARPTKSVAHVPAFPTVPSTALDANYNPPWMTIAGRTAQETNERLIQNLNDSFKDVGLVHTKPAKSSTKRKSKTGRNIFGEVPDDALYMLLPLWASETDEASQAETPRIKFDNVPVNERLYLLVYYVAFEQDLKAKSQESKKKSKSQYSPSSSLEPMDDKTIILSSFRVSARLVGYDELRGTGIRLPSTGLSVTGPVWEAVQYAPPSSIRDQHHDDIVVATCMGRAEGIHFLPEGLFKLGLTFPPSDLELQAATDLEVASMTLSPIGRSAMEMIWLGCMALTSFGAT